MNYADQKRLDNTIRLVERPEFLPWCGVPRMTFKIKLGKESFI
jgi:hypothetical protein